LSDVIKSMENVATWINEADENVEQVVQSRKNRISLNRKSEVSPRAHYRPRAAILSDNSSESSVYSDTTLSETEDEPCQF
jgi:hypothetical protein